MLIFYLVEYLIFLFLLIDFVEIIRFLNKKEKIDSAKNTINYKLYIIFLTSYLNTLLFQIYMKNNYKFLFI